MSGDVIIGGNALWIHGWTMQIHRLVEVAFPLGETREDVAGIRFHPRSKREMRVLSRFGVPMEGRILADPVSALADSMAYGGRDGLWSPDLEDLDVDALDDRYEDVRQALVSLGHSDVPIPDDIAMALKNHRAQPDF